MQQFKQDMIEFLVRAGALKFGDFTTKSGRQSPYFINAGSFRTGSQISKLGEFYAECINDAIGDSFDIMFGPAYKGITLASAATAAVYRKFGWDKEFCFNRKEIKSHGEGGQFIGAELIGGKRVIIIEDVITAGTAVRETVPLIKNAASVSLEHMFIIADRLEIGYNGKTAPQEVLEEFGIHVHSIVNVREIIDYLFNREIDGAVVLGDDQRDKMERYLEMYCVV
ncbi:orotate phosphoribosyltransferase [Clostridia bacterium]|nr:orotate phosphoribosyltransferase [Clostridia bacterium]